MLRLAVLTSCYLGTLVAQDETWVPPPKPACDSFSMQSLPVLDMKQKTCYYRSQLFTGSALFGAAFFGGIAMLRHDPPEWPQGAQGFGWQFGTRYTQGMVKSTATYVVGAIFKEDPRPLPPENPSCAGNDKYRQTRFWPRLGDSLLRVVWTQRDDCSHGISYSHLAGSLASGFVGMAWRPAQQNTVGEAFRQSASGLGGYFANSVFAEFQGDLFGYLGKMFGEGKPKPAPIGSGSPKP